MAGHRRPNLLLPMEVLHERENILYATLAVQTGLVDPAAALATIVGMARENPRAVGEVFVDQGKLTIEQHQRLSELVVAHIKNHNGDVEKSLEAAASTTSGLFVLEQLSNWSKARTKSGSGSLEVRCPSCHTPMAVAVDTVLTDLTCTSCGSHFSLIDQSKATRIAPSLSTMGRFELVERIGVGSFGTVWKARDKELDRTVAIKIPREGGMTAEEQEKFFREARAAAQLRHPNIVTVHEVGRDAESIYIVSDFIRGVTLGDWLMTQQLTGREAAEICAKVADALHHAHEQGVVHRDLKPANIIIDPDGEPHLMDFGLARREVGEATVTIHGQILGTPAYMSPEQAQGEAHTADRRSDIYSLGAILFQLLTGELPFRGNLRMLMYQVIHDDAPSPRKFNSSIPKDLETITMKCLQKAPGSRYQTAGELAADLRRFLSGEPIHARPVPKWERAIKWVRRHPAPSGLAAVLCIATLGGIAGLAWHSHTLELKRRELQHLNTQLLEVKENEREFAEEFLVGAVEMADPMHFGGYRFDDPNAIKSFSRETFLDRGRDYVLDTKRDWGPITQAELLNSIGAAYSGLGKLDKARDCLNDARALCNKLDGQGQSTVLAATLHNQGFLNFQFGRFAEAEHQLRQALKYKEELLRKNQVGIEELITTKCVLAATLLETQRGPEIKQLLKDVLATRPEIKGRDRDFALAALALALVSARLGESVDAFNQYVLARQILEDSGDELADVLDRAVQSVVQSVSGNDKSAAESIEPAVSKAEKILGTSHPVLYILRVDLAKAHQRSGKAETAATELENILRVAKQLFGDQPRTAHVVYVLGDVQRDLNRPDEALANYEAARDILDKCGQLDQYEGAEVSYRLGMLDLLQGRLNAARKKFQQNIDFEKQLHGDMQHPVVAYGHIGLALVHSVEVDLRDQELEEAVNYLRKSPGDISGAVAQLASLGDTFWHANSTDHAQILYEQVLRIHELSKENRPAQTGVAGQILRPLLQRFQAADGYPVGRANFGLGRCLLKKGLKDEAKPYIVRAAKIFNDQLGTEHPKTLEANALLDAQ